MKTNYPTKIRRGFTRKGDILKGSKRGREAAFHFIAFLDGRDGNSFIGAVLTHSSRYGNNVLMAEEHFKKTGTNDKKFEFQFGDSYLVKGKFIKLQDWGPFTKIGELTKKGIDFVDSETKDLEPELWDDYFERIQKHEN